MSAAAVVMETTPKGGQEVDEQVKPELKSGPMGSAVEEKEGGGASVEGGVEGGEERGGVEGREEERERREERREGEVSKPVMTAAEEDLIQFNSSGDETEQVRSKPATLEKPVSEPELMPAVNEDAPVISAHLTSSAEQSIQEQVVTEPVPKLVTDHVTNLKIASDPETVAKATSSEVTTEEAVPTDQEMRQTAAVGDQTETSAAPAELGITETSQLVAVEMAGLLYPTLDSITLGMVAIVILPSCLFVCLSVHLCACLCLHLPFHLLVFV